MTKSNSIMRKALFLLMFLVSGMSFSQSTNTDYVITDHSLVNNLDEYKVAIESIDWDRYRYINSRRTIKFEKGVVFELLSANELSDTHFEFDASKAFQKPEKDHYEPVYSLKANGRVVEQHISIGKR